MVSDNATASSISCVTKNMVNECLTKSSIKWSCNRIRVRASRALNGSSSRRRDGFRTKALARPPTNIKNQERKSELTPGGSGAAEAATCDASFGAAAQIKEYYIDRVSLCPSVGEIRLNASPFQRSRWVKLRIALPCPLQAETLQGRV